MHSNVNVEHAHLLELGFIPGGDVHLGTVLDECRGNGLAYPCAPAGDKGCLGWFRRKSACYVVGVRTRFSAYGEEGLDRQVCKGISGGACVLGGLTLWHDGECRAVIDRLFNRIHVVNA